MRKYEVMNMRPMTHHIRKFTLCSVMFAAAFSSLTGGLRAQSIGSQPANQSSHGSHKDWLDIAVMQKHCPSMPINVPPRLWKSREALRGRITISGNNLKINGTDDPDHIVVAAGNGPHSVSVAWNGEYLGDFGPISGITVEGNGGDDALIVKSGLRLSAIIDGGAGDNCIQGGSGGDQLLGGSGDDVLIAGTGRPALKAGSGRDRIVVPQRMGTLRFAPDTDKDVLALLDNLYDLEPLGSQIHSAKETPSPVLLGVEDLENLDLSRLQQTYAAGQAVVITHVTQADAEKLRLLLGHPNSISAPNNSQTGLGPGAPVPAVLFRKAPRPGTSAHQYHTGYIATLDGGPSDRMIEHISQIFSKNEIIVHPPAITQTHALGDTPSTDLQNLADSYVSDVMIQNAAQSGVKISNSVWGVRSFLNSADYYYVFQEADFWSGGKDQPNLGFWQSETSNQLQAPTTNPNLLQPSPASTQCAQSTTSGMSWNVGGSAGWNQTQGANATLTGGVSVSNSTTISCPGNIIANRSDPGTGETEWTYQQSYNGSQELNTFYSQWIWGIPFSSYQSGQTSLQFQSTGTEDFGAPDGPVPPAQLASTIPLPFGDTFKLQPPVVSSVSPASVKPGDNFTITGTGMYPSLVSSVVIGGESVPVTQYSTPSDTQIQIITPNQSGCDLPVVVQTGEGVSNDNVGINISGNSCQ
jgi:hypothetical protein